MQGDGIGCDGGSGCGFGGCCSAFGHHARGEHREQGCARCADARAAVITAAVVVENVNVVKKHQKPNPQRGIPGGIIDREMPLEISNVGLYNPQKGGADRVGFKTLEDGRKVRVFKSNGEVVDA